MEEKKVSPAQVQKFLGEVAYPATKDELIEAAEDQGADVEVMDALDMIEDKDYSGPTEVNQGLKKMEEKTDTEDSVSKMEVKGLDEEKTNRMSDVL